MHRSSKVKIGRGSPVWKKMCVQIIKTMFLNTKLQGLTIASCTVHNIMKGFSLHVLDAVIFVPQAALH